MTDEQSNAKKGVFKSDNCCEACKKDATGCFDVIKILLGLRSKGHSHGEFNDVINNSESPKRQGSPKQSAIDPQNNSVSRKEVSRAVPEGREVELQTKHVGVVTEQEDPNFDLNGWLNMNRTDVKFVAKFW